MKKQNRYEKLKNLEFIQHQYIQKLEKEVETLDEITRLQKEEIEDLKQANEALVRMVEDYAQDIRKSLADVRTQEDTEE